MKNKNSLESRETIVKRYFDLLKQNIGKQIEMTEVAFGVPDVFNEFILRNVFDYQTIAISYPSDIYYVNGYPYGPAHHQPFICPRVAIQRIRGTNGEVLYENPFISDDYDIFPGREFNALVKKSFESSIPNNQRFEDYLLYDYLSERERGMRRLCSAIKCIETLTSNRE